MRADAVHTPKRGSAEQRSIFKALQGSPAHLYKVHHLKVHNGWAWADVCRSTPKENRSPRAARNCCTVRGAGMVEDLSKVPEDPNDPMGAQDASAVYVNNLRKRFPGVPKDIFPKPSH